MDKNLMKLGTAGALAGVGTTYLLKYIVSPALKWLGQYTPTVTAKLANPAIDINVQGSVTGVNTGLTGWLSNALGLTIPSSAVFQLVAAAIGGALLFIAGAYVVDILKISGSSKMKLGATIFAGNLIAGVILGTTALSLGITMVNVIIAFAINAAILAWLFTVIDDQLKLGLNPF